MQDRKGVLFVNELFSLVLFWSVCVFEKQILGQTSAVLHPFIVPQASEHPARGPLLSCV